MTGLVVDLFAGGGGASLGIERALGRPIDLAVNHSPEAIAMHTRNHLATRHAQSDVWHVSPREACAGRDVELLWASPACTHFSRAKGAANAKSAKIRALAWVVNRWAREVRPRVIVLENVEEFLTWGPLDAEGRPIKAKAGLTFKHWLGKLRAQGYAIEYRSLVAADYGTPTTRRRLFLIARCDREPIVWPEPTHGRGRALPWRSAAECIDWSIPCRSIFGRKKPLAEATMRRIAAGVRRFVLDAARPFIVRTDMHLSNAGCVYDTAEPLRTVTSAGGFGVVQPFVVPVKSWGGGGNEARGLDEPSRTITASKRGEFALVAPALVQLGHGEREGQAPRALDPSRPLGTVTAGGRHHGLVAAMLTKHFGGAVGQQATLPLGTVTSRDHHALTTATIAPSAVDRREEVRAFLVKYYGGDGDPTRGQQSLFEPLHTVTSRARFGLVLVEGVEYEIADIGMRMLAPSELFAAQGFPSDYDRSGLTNTAQIALCGNSVCPQVAEAIVRANLTGERARRAA